MSTKLNFLVFVAIIACSTGALSLAGDSTVVKPLPVNEHWQLFLDNYIVARSTGFDRVVHHPQPRGLVIPADKPWETAGAELLYGTPVGRRKDGSFYAFYRALWWDPASTENMPDGMKKDRAHQMRQSVGYAVSQDGLRWEKPNLGLINAPAETKFNGSFPYPSGETKQNNLGVPIMDPTDLGLYGNISDPKKRFIFRVIPDPNDPKQQSMFNVIGSQWPAFFSAEMPDLLKDTKWEWRDKLTPTGSALNPRRHFVNYWDALHEEWVALDQGVGPGHWLPSREIARFSSKDLKTWKAEAAFYPDAEDPHTLENYHEPMTLHPFWSEGIVIGLLSWFHSDRSHPDGGPVLQPNTEHPYRWPWARKGICDTRVTMSRDGGKTWDRTVSREAWIPASTAEHAYDRQAIRPAPPVRVGDEDWFYVTVMDGNHLIVRNNPGQDSYYHDRVAKHQIALYTQPHNRYVSMRARRASPEVLITKPVLLQGNQLQLNVDASHGEVRVAIASAEDQSVTLQGDTRVSVYAPHIAKPFTGLSFKDCKPIRSNSIEHTVTFSEDASLKKLADKPVFLLFELSDADLYGFRVVP